MHVLDNPVWSALTSRQASFAKSSGGLRRYRPDIGPFVGSADQTPESFADLADLVTPGDHAVLNLVAPIAPPPGFTIRMMREAVQMVAVRSAPPPPDLAFDVLGDADAPDMLDLALRTEPGPFRVRTHDLGRFVGIRVEDRLVAMAGERMRCDGYTEVSAVCTDPAHRGRGYAAALMIEVMRGIVARGETPFLHAYADNAGAIALYERLGYTLRRRPVLMALERV